MRLQKVAAQAFQKAWHTLSDESRELLKSKELISRHTADAINVGTENIIAKNKIPTTVVDYTPEQFGEVIRSTFTNPHSLVGHKQVTDAVERFKRTGGALSHLIEDGEGYPHIEVHKFHSNPSKMQESLFETSEYLKPTTQESSDYLKAIIDRHEADEARYTARNYLRGKNSQFLTHADRRVLESESKNITFAPEETKRILGTIRFKESLKAKEEGLNYIDIMNYGNKR